ncbi:MAG TPA: TonB-dependent receptor plug domain-containing protein [Polyangia bacterium]|nr:TonB-dependent receptor plug domain-containing protein [Polyangia bacterium]
MENRQNLLRTLGRTHIQLTAWRIAALIASSLPVVARAQSEAPPPVAVATGEASDAGAPTTVPAPVTPGTTAPITPPANPDAGAEPPAATPAPPPPPPPGDVVPSVGPLPPITATPVPPPPSAQQLGEVVVTAERREQSAQSVASALTVLKGENLTENQIGRSANEVLNYVPNASAVTQLHTRPRWWIRGVGTGQQQPDVSNPIGFYLDDVYISNATATGFPLFDLDRVEVLRGPQGTLWGKNTTGGAINVVTRRPDFTSNDGYLRFDDATFNDRILEGGAGDVIWKDHLAARLAFHYEARGGRFTNLYTDTAEGQFQDGAVRLQLLGKITPDLLVTGNVHFRQYGSQGATNTTASNAANGVYLLGYVPSTDVNVVDTNAPANDAITQNGAFINLKWRTPLFTLTSISAYEDFRDQTFADSDYTPIEISRAWTQVRSYQFTEELRLASAGGNRLSWVAGAFYFHENIDSDSVAAKLPGLALEGPAAPNYADTGFEHRADSGSVFASATVQILKQLNVTGGLRLTTERRQLDFLREATVPGVAASFSDPSRWWLPQSVNTPLNNWFAETLSNTWTNLTGDITPQVQLTKDAQIYFRYAHGVKSGGYNTAATTQAALNVVQPERLDDLELGAKTRWLGNRLSVNANAFHYDYRNIQVNVVGPLPPTNTAVSYLQNVAAGRVYGGELEVEGLPIENLHVSGNLGLLDTKFTDFQVLNGGANYSGNQFVRSPHVNLIVLADYRVPLGAGRVPSLVLAGDWRFTSRQFHYATNQTDPLLQTPALSLINARVALVSPDEKVSLTFYATNLADVKYRAHSLPGATGATGDVAIWGEPRVWGVSLLARWW